MHADVSGEGHTQTFSACQPTCAAFVGHLGVFSSALMGRPLKVGFMVGDIIISDRRSHKELLYNQNLPASSLLSFTN